MLMAQGLYNHSTVPVDEDDNPLYWGTSYKMLIQALKIDVWYKLKIIIMRGD